MMGGTIKRQALTQTRLKELLHYSPDTGVWTWKKDRGGTAKNGSQAGSLQNKGYRGMNIDNVYHRSCRLAWLYMEGYYPEHEIDHINRIRDDDRWENLRHISAQCNVRNRKMLKNNTSGVTGITWVYREGKWQSSIRVNTKTKHLGYFKREDFDEAVLFRLAAEQCLDWNGCDSSSSAYKYALKNNLVRR